jgi:hypothetical protein
VGLLGKVKGIFEQQTFRAVEGNPFMFVDSRLNWCVMRERDGVIVARGVSKHWALRIANALNKQFVFVPMLDADEQQVAGGAE